MYAVLSRYLLKQFYCGNLFKRTRSVLVIAQHNNEILNPATQETITAARKIGGELAVLVAGQDCSTIAKLISSVKGLHKVLISEDLAFNGFLAENLTPLILAVQKQFGFTHIMAGATTFGKTILPRVAGKLNVSAVTDVIDIKDFNTFVRPIYGGNAYMTLKTKDPVNIITVRPTYFEPCAIQENEKLHSTLVAVVRAMNLYKVNPRNKNKMEKYLRLKQAAESLRRWQAITAPIFEVPAGAYNTNLTLILKQDFITATKSKLEETKIIICGGKGMQSAHNFKMLYNLAQHINAEVGASKAAVDAGFASSNIQISQNGNIVAPNLYIAVGVSGTPQHIAAIKNSKMIVAINKNPNAPIFKFAHYGLIGDLFKIIPELNIKLKPQVKTNKSCVNNYIQSPYFNII